MSEADAARTRIDRAMAGRRAFVVHYPPVTTSFDSRCQDL